MPKKRKKRRGPPPISAEALFWSLFAINLVLGCFLSPITSVRKAKVIGAHPESHADIEADLKQLEGVPYALIRRGWVENRLLLDGSASAVEWKGNIFGRVGFTLLPRQAVARVVGEGLPEDMALDKEGRLFRSVHPQSGLVALSIPQRAKESTGLILSGWEAGTAGAFAAGLPEVLGGDLTGSTITMTEDSAFKLDISGSSLDLGALPSVDEALEQVVAFVKSRPSMGFGTESSRERDQTPSRQGERDQTATDPKNSTGSDQGTGTASPPVSND